ncbi:MAG: cytochrome c [Opitutaceae bacterium]|jgi:mono/diheme cytochrome c family protein
MSAPEYQDPRFDRAAFGDDQLVDAHENALRPGTDDRAHYRLLPLMLLFVLSGCVLCSAMYVIRYSGHFNYLIYDENEQQSQTAAAVKVDPIAMGKRLFNTPSACVTCHQPTGQGIPGVYPPLAGSELVNGPDERIIRILLDGLKGPVQVRGTSFPGTVQMPSFGAAGFNWSDEKIADVLSYVRQEWGNKAPPVDAAKVAQIRQQVSGHKEWTQEELLQVK